ncbi:uncharacterized protein TNCV_3812711 [Trichonephila clavipes]|nr:uncharacterized protein TNCV_3812711 [Trichonephila clavipes]
MLPQDILGAATGVGLALFIALSAIICKYYSRTRKERMILYSPPRRPSQDRRQKRLMHMREASAMAALPPQQQTLAGHSGVAFTPWVTLPGEYTPDVLRPLRPVSPPRQDEAVCRKGGLSVLLLKPPLATFYPV